MHAATLVSLLLGAVVAAPPPSQEPLLESNKHTIDHEAATVSKSRPLAGKFLVVTGTYFFRHGPNAAANEHRFGTDFHPDSFYEVYTSTADQAACHRGTGPAGIYGAETSDCDSPISLVNETFRWIEQELRDQIDFVVWTGDSARHDNDEKLPRSVAQVEELNKMMVQKFVEVFGKDDRDDDNDPTNDLIIPVVPTYGNNDILPHNIMAAGPNRWTKSYAKIWRNFIPEEQRHQFEQGGWFYVEVIPSKLAVFSLNTLYFFDKNSAVDGCAKHSEPGYRQMEWLRIQLQFMRERGMKAIVMGHVPPGRTESQQSWDETCWQKYALWMRQYRDVIVGSLYGHMNIDHFMLQDFEDIDEDTENGRMGDYDESAQNEGDVDIQVSGEYLVELREEWASLPKLPKKVKAKDASLLQELGGETGLDWELEGLFSDVMTNDKKKDRKRKKQKKKQRKLLRKIGGPFAERFATSLVAPSVVPNYFPAIRVIEYNITGLGSALDWETMQPVVDPSEQSDVSKSLEDNEQVPAALRKKKPKKYKFKVPEGPSKSAPPGPAYSPQTLSWLGYTQYYANLTHINNDFAPASETLDDGDFAFDAAKWKEGKHKGKHPHNKDHKPDPKNFKYEVEYSTGGDGVYNMSELTTRSWLELAWRIGQYKPEKGDSVSEVEAADGADGSSVSPWDSDDGEEDNSVLRKGGKHKKHKKKKGKRKIKNKAWYAFVQRAFVSTMDPDDIEERFGR